MIVVVRPNTKTVTVVPTTSEVVVNSPITALSQMNDVNISNPVDGDILKYESGEWINSPIGADLNFTYNQSPASAVWTINHNLNKFPNYTVIDSSGDEVEGDVTYINNNQLTLTFSAAFSGTAYLN